MLSQENQSHTPGGNNNRPAVDLPNATAVLVLGILSLVLCICYGFIGLILSIIAISLASKDLKLYHANPGLYTSSSYNNLTAGRVCAIIGLCLSALFVLYVIWLLVAVGISNVTDIEHLMNH